MYMMFDPFGSVRRRYMSPFGWLAVSVLVLAGCGPETLEAESTHIKTKPAQASSLSPSNMPQSLRAAVIATEQAQASEQYFANVMGDVIRLDNPAQSFVSVVDRNGLSVGADDHEGQLELRTSALGCVDSGMNPVDDAVPSAVNNRVTFPREGLEEWYLNGPQGMEHGFVLQEAPQCAGAKRVRIAIEGAFAARLDDPDGDGRGASVTFVDATGMALFVYSDLHVMDASGKTLRAWMTTVGRDVTIDVDDAGAVYPLTIDPLIGVLQTHLDFGNGQYWRFGDKVDIEGDTAIITRHCHYIACNSGAVYAYVRNGLTWTLQQQIASKFSYNSIAYSVSLSGDTLLLGNPEVGTQQFEDGAFQVWVRNGTTWTLQQEFLAPVMKQYGHFGSAVALEGDNAAVFGPTASGYATYLYVRNGTTWTQQQVLQNVGSALAMSGNTLVATNTSGAAATADVYTYDGATWSLQAQLSANDPAADSSFGIAAAISGDTAIIGANGTNDAIAGAYTGAAYVFRRNGTTWSQAQKLMASDKVSKQAFGSSVAVEGDTAIVGISGNFASPNVNQGAYVFSYNGATWSEQKLLPAGILPAANFGYSVAVNGGTLLVGAPEQGSNFSTAGFVYFYALVPTGSNGTPCSSNAQCQNGACVDGICCDSACGNGDPNDCQACSIAAGGSSDGTCTAVTSAQKVCRAAVGDCDVAEFCNGASGTCPADVVVGAGTVCRLSAGPCDATESCNGVSGACPANALVPAGTVCRASANTCDVAESCDGSSVACPVDNVAAAGTVCRASAGVCDIAESCDGTNVVCPSDTQQPSSYACRVAANDCDAIEFCTGSSVVCPSDSSLPNGTMCANGTCDNGACMGQGGASGAGSSSSSSGAPLIASNGCSVASPSEDSNRSLFWPAIMSLVFFVVKRRKRSHLRTGNAPESLGGDVLS